MPQARFNVQHQLPQMDMGCVWGVDLGRGRGGATWLSDTRSSPAWGRMGQVSQAGIIARPPTTTADFSWNRFLCKTWWDLRQVGVWQKVWSHRIIGINPFIPISQVCIVWDKSIYIEGLVQPSEHVEANHKSIFFIRWKWLCNWWLTKISIPQRCVKYVYMYYFVGWTKRAVLRHIFIVTVIIRVLVHFFNLTLLLCHLEKHHVRIIDLAIIALCCIYIIENLSVLLIKYASFYKKHKTSREGWCFILGR